MQTANCNLQNETGRRQGLVLVMTGLLCVVGGCTAEPAGFRQSPWAGVLYINEFMASNNSTVADEFGDYADWIEIHNAGAEAVSLHGMYLTDNLANPTKWAFPDTIVQPGGYILVWADAAYRQGPLHASFRLDAGDGEQLGLFAADGDRVYFVDTLSFGTQRTDTSYGRLPDGGQWTEMAFPTPGAANISGESGWRGRLFINEFLADNDATVADEAGDFDDWVELYNATDSAVGLAGWYLTDDLRTPRAWQFPDVSIPAHGFLLVWCDNEPAEGPLHATFSLAAAAGEQLGLFAPSGAHALAVDTLSFGHQGTDTSYGRLPDGGEWQLFTSPTPGRSNSGRR
jgi:hypothetical protein